MSDLEKFLRRRLAEDEAAAFEAASGPVVSDLVTWFRAQMDADEQVALATIGVNVRAGMRRGESPPRWTVDGSEIRDDSPDRILRVRHTWAREAEHIAVHDPARVLRQVAAMRAIVDACEYTLDYEDYGWPLARDVLRHLVTIYADRDGYGEWTP